MMERADICPQCVHLEDGAVRPAPWMEWHQNAQQWYCELCYNSVTADHLVAPRHTKRQRDWWNWYAHDLGQPITDAVTHQLYVSAPRWHNHRGAARQQPRPPAIQGGVDDQQQPRPAIQDGDPPQPQPAAPAQPPPPPPPAVVDGTQQLAEIIELLRRMVEQNATIIELLQGTREEVSGLTQRLDVVANNTAMRGPAVRRPPPPATRGTRGATTPPPGAGCATVAPPPGLVQDD